MNRIEKTLALVVIELIKKEAILSELERAFPLIDNTYYCNRKSKIERRISELKEILGAVKIGTTKDAPAEQYLIVEY